MSEKHTNGAANPSARALLDDTARLRNDLTTLADHTQRAVAGWRRYLRVRLEQQPYATVVVAAGIGCVLGGGLPRPVVRAVIAIGGRIAAERVLGEVARTLVEARD